MLDLLQAELGAPDQHHLAVLEPLLEHIAQAQHARDLAGRQHVHVEAEAHLQLGQPEQALHQHRRIDGAALGLEHQTHASQPTSSRTSPSSGSFLSWISSAMLLHQPRLLHLIGHLGDDDLVAAAAGILLLPAGAQPEPAAAGLVGLEDGLARLDDDAAGREIRARHEFDQLLDGGVRMLDQMQQRAAQLIDIVRRDVGRHADGDAGRAVGQQVGKGRRENGRLLLAPIVVGTKIDGVLVDAVEQLRRR